MFVSGIGTAVPRQRYLKSECWEAFQQSDWFQRLNSRTHAVAKTVLLHDNGIEARHLALESLEHAFQIDPDTLHARFLENAPALARKAGKAALKQATLEPLQIDAVVVSTCTGYLCPGLMISACLFGDGAGAAVLSRLPQKHARRIEWQDSESLINPSQRNALQFE